VLNSLFNFCTSICNIDFDLNQVAEDDSKPVDDDEEDAEPEYTE
jgi:hypothetical protein